MQTFMPYNDFSKIAKCLDNKRLGKQRVEVLQIYQTLQKIEQRNNILKMNPISVSKFYDKPISWEHHPIVKMWKGHECALLQYGIIICNEWIRRGFKDTLKERFMSEKIWIDSFPIFPDWICDSELNLSHQSNLVRKLPEHYKKYFPNVPDNLEYKWIRG